MRCVDEPGRSLRLFRLAVLASISVAAVSCSSDTHRFESDKSVRSAKAQAPANEVTGSVAAKAVRDPERAAAAADTLRRRQRGRSSSAPPAVRTAWRPMSRTPARRSPARPQSAQARLELGRRHRHHGAEGRHHRRPGDALWRAGLRDRRSQQHSERHGAAARPAPGHPEIRGDRQHVAAHGVQRAACAGAAIAAPATSTQPARPHRRARRDADGAVAQVPEAAGRDSPRPTTSSRIRW